MPRIGPLPHVSSLHSREPSCEIQVTQGGRFGGWSLYVKNGVPACADNFRKPPGCGDRIPLQALGTPVVEAIGSDAKSRFTGHFPKVTVEIQGAKPASAEAKSARGFPACADCTARAR